MQRIAPHGQMAERNPAAECDHKGGKAKWAVAVAIPSSAVLFILGLSKVGEHIARHFLMQIWCRTGWKLTSMARARELNLSPLVIARKLRLNITALLANAAWLALLQGQEAEPLQ